MRTDSAIVREACDRSALSLPEAQVAFKRFEEQFKAAMDCMNYAWTIICNVGEGDWTKENQEWQDAAARCRDQYHALLDSATSRANVADDYAEYERGRVAGEFYRFARCPECQHATVGLAPPYEINHAEYCPERSTAKAGSVPSDAAFPPGFVWSDEEERPVWKGELDESERLRLRLANQVPSLAVAEERIERLERELATAQLRVTQFNNGRKFQKKRAEAAEAALKGVAWKDSDGLCWCPGETEFAVAHLNADHTPRCLAARAALASQERQT